MSREGEGWTLPEDCLEGSYPTYEEFTCSPWVNLYLQSINKVLSRVSQGELIDPFPDYAPVPWSLSRGSVSESTRLRFGRSYKVYDLVTKILSKPLPIPLGTGSL